MKKALFGISLDNPLYSSMTMRTSLAAGLRDYDEIVFLIADSLQIYNYVAKNVRDKTSAAAVDWSSPTNQYLSERTTWLSKIRSRLPDWNDQQKWTIVGVNQISDKKTFQIQRSVRILYAVDDAFRNDVIAFAQKFAERDSNLKSYDERVRLSILYILEEIALNIRLRVRLDIEDEFYLGHTFEIFRNIYGGKYIKNHFELFGSKSDRKKNYNFHSWDTKSAAWVLENGIVHYEHDDSKVVVFGQS